MESDKSWNSEDDGDGAVIECSKSLFTVEDMINDALTTSANLPAISRALAFLEELLIRHNCLIRMFAAHMRSVGVVFRHPHH